MTALENIEAEQTVLGTLLARNDAVDAIPPSFQPGDFSMPVHARIYEAIVEMIADGRAASAITLKAAFEHDKGLHDVGGAAYLGRLANAYVMTSSLPSYCNLLSDLTVKRRLSMLGNDLVLRIEEQPKATPAELVQHVETGLVEATERRATKGGNSIAAASANVYRTIAEPGTVDLIPTRLASLDRMVKFARGRYIVVGGRASMGKSALALSIAGRVASSGSRAQAKGRGVAVFSLEMSEDQCAARLMAAAAWNRDHPIPYSAILDPASLRSDEIARLQDVRGMVDGLSLWIDDRAGLTPSQIAMAVRKAQRMMRLDGLSLDLVVVDHIGKMRPDRRTDNKVVETGEISGALAALAKDCDVCVLACVQLNRQTEGREDKRPTLADLRWSGDIEQDADAVLLVYRPAYYLDRMAEPSDPGEAAEHAEKRHKAANRVEIVIAKNRHGPIGGVDLFCDIASNKFADLEFR